jgi:hypothetical protein
VNPLHLVGCAFAVMAAMPPLAAQVAIPSHAALLNPTAPLLTARFAVADQAIHMVGVTTGQFPHFVHYARSVDGGRSFPLREVPLAWLGTTSPVTGVLGDLVVDGDAVLAVVSMPWAGPWLLRSLDQGASWRPPVRVSVTSLPVTGLPASLHAHQGKVAVVWPENRSNGTLWANHSSDGGASWWPLDLPLDVGLPVGLTTAVLVRGHGASLHVIYNRGSTPWVAYHQYSRNGGATWLPAPQPISTVQLAHFAATPSLLVAGGNYGDPLLRSLDDGQTWGPLVVPGLLATDAIRSIAADGNRILVVGTRGSTLPQPVLLQVSGDGGQSWLAEPYQVPMFRSATITAHVGPDALMVHFAFQDQRFPAAAMIQSDDGGLRWRLVTGTVDRGMVPLRAGFLALAGYSPTGGHWQVWVAEGHTRHGQGSPGTGGIEPQLRGEGTAGLGRTVRYAVGDVVGAAPLLCCWSAEPLGAMPLGGGLFYLQQLVASRLLAANGAAGVAGAGSALTSVTIPNATALAGVRLACQAAVLDAAAGGGVALTAAVESWVY